MVGSSTVRLGQRLDPRRVAQRVGHLGLGDAGKGDDVPGGGRFHLDPVQAVKAQDLADPLGALAALAAHHGHGHAAACSVPRLMRPMPMAPT